MKQTFKLDGLGCASCASKMENKINKLDGVSEVTINFFTTKMIIEAQEDKIDTIIEQARKIIKKLEPGVVLNKA